MPPDDVDQPEMLDESATAPKEIHAGDIASVIAAMNRFLSSFGQHPILKNAQLTLADWLVLTLLSQKGADNSKALSKAIGVSQPRMNQVLEALMTAGLVTFKGTGPKDTIEVTEQGRTRLDEIGATLQPKFAEVFKGRERSVVATERALKLMLRVVNAATDR